MTGTGQRSALGALDAGRPALTRLDPSRHPEEVAADLIELWSSIETALRSLLGGSMASGPSLIRELREREMISLEQAHAFLQFFGIRERVDRVDYKPTAADVQAAREAYDALERGLRAPSAPAEQPPPSLDAIPLTPPSPVADPVAPVAAHERSRRTLWLGATLIVLAILIVGGGVYWYTGRSGVPSEVAKAIADYQAGRHDSAREAFVRATRDHPKLVLPHLYLARLAREQGDYTTAGSELKAALELEPANATALRELGALFLARGTHFANQGRPDLATADYDAARRSYVKSLSIDPTDRDAQGYLGCALVRLGRAQEASSWAERAGPGLWSACTAPEPAGGGSPRVP